MIDWTRVLRRYFNELFTDDTEPVENDATSPGISPTGATATASTGAPTATPLPGSDATPTATNSPTMTGSLEMRIGSLNVKNTPDIPRASVVKCGAIAKQQGAGIYCMQEIGQEDHRPLSEGLGPNYRDCHPNIQVPIFVDKTRYDIITAGNQLMHDGLAGASPPRYVSWVILKSKQNPNMPKFRVANTHMAVQKDNALKAQAWRIKMWEQHLTKMQQLFREWERELVFIAGDFNPDHRPVNLPGVRWVVVHDPDKIGVKSPATLKTAFVDEKTFSSPSDHRGLIARFTIRSN